MSPHPQPPLHQITNTPKHAGLPDLVFTALSVLFLFSSSSSSSTVSAWPNCKTYFPKIPFLSFSTNSRRFLKFSSMSHPKPSREYNLRHFASPQSLSDWLERRLPSDSFASWGVKPGTKNVHNLWLELAEGETSLADSTPPVRSLNVVTVRIQGPKDTVLVESHQHLSDGSVRQRCRPLSEKMKPDETPEEAVFRAIREELGSILVNGGDNGIIKIVPGSYTNKVEERNSVSYPGLPAKYVLHSVDVVVDGLPDGEFFTEEAEEYTDSAEKRTADKAVSVKRHFWKWVSADSVQS